MRLAIRHSTSYRFGDPTTHALQRLRLTPKETQGQKIIEWSMQFQNAQLELEYEDQHCNKTSLIAVTPGAGEVMVTCEGVVETRDNAGVIGRHSGDLPLWSFLRQTRLTQPGARLRNLVADLQAPDASKIDFLHALSQRIRERVAYQVGGTNVDTSAEEAAAGGCGVCQDHAHIFIGAARLANIPARYVSGYLLLNDRDEQDATHAWAEAHVEELGWVGFDISNGISPDTRYVRVATGHDYSEAAPIIGMSFGATAGAPEVNIMVAQQQSVQ
jgi:transglutaminase-like putative cysteine protease